MSQKSFVIETLSTRTIAWRLFDPRYSSFWYNTGHDRHTHSDRCTYDNGMYIYCTSI